MSRDWLLNLVQRNAYVCHDPEAFLNHISESGSRKKYFTLEHRNDGKVRLWMILEGVTPVIIGFKDFSKEDDANKFVKERLHDFLQLTPLSMVINSLA